jgi:hypothetical protein
MLLELLATALLIRIRHRCPARGETFAERDQCDRGDDRADAARAGSLHLRHVPRDGARRRPHGRDVVSVRGGRAGAGSQIHFKIGGTFVNDGGSAYAAGAQARITSGNTIVFMGSRASATSTGAGIGAVRAWETDCTIAASVVGLSGQYLPNIKSATRARPAVQPQGASIAFTNVCKQLITDFSVASTPDFGGLILNTAGNGSIMSSTVFQQNFSLSQPILVEILVNPPILGTGTVGNMTIQMGYMEGL